MWTEASLSVVWTGHTKEKQNSLCITHSWSTAQCILNRATSKSQQNYLCAIAQSEERTHTSLPFYRVTFPPPEDSQAWQPALGTGHVEELLITGIRSSSHISWAAWSCTLLVPPHTPVSRTLQCSPLCIHGKQQHRTEPPSSASPC